jgi:protein-tyrosine phosphatase
MGAGETDHTRKAFNSYDKILKDIAGQNGIKISCDRFPVKDLDIPDSENMTHILDAIDESIAKHNPVYVHCAGVV